MLRPRIIPCLLIKDGALVKTINFKDETYVGDPVNVVKILNEKEVDELIVLDISCSVNKREINYRLIENIASECRMPLCYGGGISSVDQISKLISIGVEKVAISSSIFKNIDFLNEAIKIVGSQSIAIVLDVRKINNQYIIYLENGRSSTGLELFQFSKQILAYGFGELIINSIDLDGTLKGFDFDIVREFQKFIKIPFTIIGGASSHLNIKELFENFGNVGAGVGSLFVFKGKFRAVLVNYPIGKEKIDIISNQKIK